MKKRPFSKFLWPALFLIVLNVLAWNFNFRMDLTRERRFTLSKTVKDMLGKLDSPVSIDVFLEGDMPAGFRKLANSSKDLLLNFKEASRGNVLVNFRNPLTGLDDSARAQLMDSLQSMGLNPMNVKAQVKEGEGQEERFIYPGAVLSYKGRVIAVDFLRGQSSVNGLNSLNNAEALLEFNFASAIHKLTRDSVPVIGYLVGNGQPLSYNVYDLIERNLRRNYIFRIIPLDSVKSIPTLFNAVLVAKPTKKFTDIQKLKIDQYVMHGGKMLWMIDNLYAEMDSLKRVQNEFVAFDRGLNLEDLLFKYGIRLPLDLVQDLNSAKIPSVIGMAGGKPQVELLPWPYFPLVGSYNCNHPISKNLDYVMMQFPSSLDTVQAAGVKKTCLLTTSADSRILSSPAIVSWNTISRKDDLKSFTSSFVPVAYLLEGKFSSLYNNRLSKWMQDSLSAAAVSFAAQSPESTKMVVVSDGDVALNAVTNEDGPLPMGMNPYTKYRYANAEFIMNTLEYLADPTGVMETRSKEYALRLLDPKKLDEQRTRWQLINIVLPLALILIFAFVYRIARNYRYQRPQ
jgi:gliding-associated putative ABC transporter substrate-binding component GldG